MPTNEEKNAEQPQKTMQDILEQLFELQSQAYILYEACDLRSDRKPGSKHAAHASDVARSIYKKTKSIAGELSLVLQQ